MGCQKKKQLWIVTKNKFCYLFTKIKRGSYLHTVHIKKTTSQTLHSILCIHWILLYLDFEYFVHVSLDNDLTLKSSKFGKSLKSNILLDNH